jgi:hypothetical protein
MRPLDCLHVQVAAPLLLLDSRIFAVGQGAAAPVAQACDVVFVSTKVLGLCFGLEAAVVMVYDLPDDLIVLHGAEGDSVRTAAAC